MSDFVISSLGMLDEYTGSDINVVIPDGVTDIGWFVFSKNSTIESVTLPNSLQTIGMGAFAHCSKLTSVVIPESVQKIEREAFVACRALSDVSIGNKDIKIGVDAFTWCDSLADENGFAIGGSILLKYEGNDSEVVIPQGVTRIASQAFRYRKKMHRVAVPEGVTEITAGAFEECLALTHVVLPDSLVKLPKTAFKGCDNIANVVCSPRVFANVISANGICSYLRGEIEIVQQMKPVYKRYIEQKRDEITPILIKQDDAIAMDAYLQGFCDKLSPDDYDALLAQANEKKAVKAAAVIVQAKAKRFSAETLQAFEEDKQDKALGLKNMTLADWKRLFRFKNENGEVTITKYIGTDENVFVPDVIGKGKVVRIGKEAFKNCSAVKSVVVSDGVKDIWYDAFKGCTSLASVTLPDDTVAHGAFNECLALADKDGFIVVGKTLHKYIGKGTDLIIPNGVAKIGRDAFANHKALKSITIPGGVTEIGSSAFSGCTSLTSVDIPEGVTEIGDSAFYRCNMLASVTLPVGVTRIGEQALGDCNALAEIDIPNGVLEIGAHAFKNCTKFKNITIPDSVVQIGSDAFKSCWKIDAIFIQGATTELGETVFKGCPNLTVHAPAGSKAEEYAKKNGIKFEAL